MSDPRIDITAIATRAAAHPEIEAAVMGALRVALPGVIEGILRDMYGGQTLRAYIPKGRRERALSRRQQIEADIDAGLPHGLIAEKHGLSERQVRRYAGVARG